MLHHVVTASGECVRFVYLRLGLRPRVALYTRSIIEVLAGRARRVIWISLDLKKENFRYIR